MVPWIMGSATVVAASLFVLVPLCKKIGVSGGDIKANDQQFLTIYVSATVATVAMVSFGAATLCATRRSSLDRDFVYLVVLNVGPAVAAAGTLAVWIWLVRLARTRHRRATKDLSAQVCTRPN